MTFAIEHAQRAEFEAELGRLTRPGGALAGWFDPAQPIAIARAPGRLDVMGGIADYSGSLVLELPTEEAAFVAAQLHPEPVVAAVSIGESEGEALREARLPSAELVNADYAEASAAFRASGSTWAAYVAGSVVPFVRECGLRLDAGARLLVRSRVPEGKGVSSSAAVEVAAFYALTGAAGLEISGERAALLCQKVENLVVGAPCGVMDQMTSACGRSGCLLELLCQPASVRGHVQVPPAIAFFGVDSGLRHAVSGADYGAVRAAAFMGYRLLAGAAGLEITALGDGRVRIADPRWGGYLANVTPAELEAGLVQYLPVELTGGEFIARYTGTTDSVTRVAEHRRYPVRAATEHPIREHARVRRFAELLPRAGEELARAELGSLMYESHASYSACGLGSPGTDRLVELVRELGPAHGLYGAKITGGGSGGTVAVLARADAGPAVRRIAERYARETGNTPRVFAGSSEGAAAVGVRSTSLAALR